MTVEISLALPELIRKAYYIWFTTVRADGMPQPTPVWFVQEGGTFLIYSMPDTQKVRNIRQNPKVALSFAGDDEAENFIVIMGEASIDTNAPPIDRNQVYLTKYAEGIPGINMTPQNMAKSFSTAIRVTPTQVRGE
jgi:PPOX class probable F420-dependent enzyme